DNNEGINIAEKLTDSSASIRLLQTSIIPKLGSESGGELQRKAGYITHECPQKWVTNEGINIAEKLTDSSALIWLTT
ncbi:Hypothetical protein FKW44_007468, partial [Caligus rogercresseyi]